MKTKQIIEKAEDGRPAGSNWKVKYAQAIIKARSKWKLNFYSLMRIMDETSAAHHEFEKTLGKPDANWSQWYADFIDERLSQINPDRPSEYIQTRVLNYPAEGFQTSY